MSLPDARARLAQQQAALVRALVAQGEPPAGFAEDRVRLAARSLVNKRLREVARAWPALVEALGDRFGPRFTAFAQSTPPPGDGGPMADGRAFLPTLSADELTDDLRLAAVWADLGRSRWPSVRLAWLRGSGRLAVGARLPWLGLRVTTLPLPRVTRPRTPGGSPRPAGG
jgi:hypothetical protein